MTTKLPPTPTTQGTPRAQCHEYYFRGLGELPSMGMSMLASSRQGGTCTTSSHSWMEAGRIAQHVLSDPEKRQQTIYLAGHSMGALAAFETAKTLQKNGVKVGALATVDRAFAIESSRGLGIKTQEEHSWPLHLINSFTSMSSIGSFFDAAQQPSHTARHTRQATEAPATPPHNTTRERRAAPTNERSSQRAAHTATPTHNSEEHGSPSRTLPYATMRTASAESETTAQRQPTQAERRHTRQERAPQPRTPSHTTPREPAATPQTQRTLHAQHHYIIEHNPNDTSVMGGGVRIIHRGSSEYDAAQQAMNQNAPRQPKGRGRG